MPQKPNSAKPQTDRNKVATENHFTSSKMPALPSCGELERSAGQAIQKAYRQHLGHLPTRVSCHLFANRLSVWIENSLTPVEVVLFSSEPSAAQPVSGMLNVKYAQAVRFAIDRALEHRLSKVVEACLDVDVLTLIAGTCHEQKCTSLMVLLSDTPAVRNPERVPKTLASRQAGRKVVIKGQVANSSVG